MVHCSCSLQRAGEQNVPRAVFGTDPWGSPTKEREQDHQTLRECAPEVGPGVVKTPCGYLLPAPSSDETSRMCQKPFSGEKGPCLLPQGQRCISGPQWREGPWVRIASRQDFILFPSFEGKGKQGQGRKPPENSNARQGLAVTGGGGGHVPHLGTENGTPLSQGGAELRAARVLP